MITTVSLSSLAAGAAAVRAARVREALDHPFEADVTVAVPDFEGEVADLIGDDCAVQFERPGKPPRRLVGLVLRAEQQRGRIEDGVILRLTVAPALALLGYTRDTRIFQEKTAPEIVEEVLGAALGAYGRKVRLELAGEYPTREYCVQYQETNLAFVQRLMEEEGITYAFDHEGDVEEMVLHDRNQGFPELPAPPFEGGWSPVTEHEPIHDFGVEARSTTTSVVVRDYDFTGPSAPEEELRAEDAQGRDRESYEHGHGRSLSLTDYDDGVRRYQAHDAARQAEVRQQALVTRGRTFRGVARVTAIAPGRRFTMSGHPQPGMDGEYLIVQVSHENRAPDGIERSLDDGYHNGFVAIPVDVPYRPARRTPKPRVRSSETAVVVGPAGEEIHTDAHGRVKVQFHWDRQGASDERSSCWLRVTHPWAGPGWGFLHLPRIGMEAVVVFAHGDPDRPCVLATTYDAAHPLPYPLPDEKTKSTLKSESSLGGGGNNELRFEDKAGSEQIYLHAQKDLDEEVLANHSTHVGNDQTNTVDNDQTQTIGKDQKEDVGANQTLTVGSERKVTVNAAFKETIDSGETRVIQSGSKETFIGPETRIVAGGVSETIVGGETRTQLGGQVEMVTSKLTQVVAGTSTRVITGALTQTAAGPLSWATPAAYTLLATGGFEVKSTAGIVMMAPSISIVAADEKESDGQIAIKIIGLTASATGVNIGVDGLNVSAQGVSLGKASLALDRGAVRAEVVGVAVSLSGVKLSPTARSTVVGILEIVNTPMKLMV